ncbi:uncharacterized protein CTRU02_200322 [Colletotrichum truncatum]|uniref:Uncharacterized protein n=1 Tax=Colletotrichum truncatum TaxID=5467 RepID=A0ACC3ZEB2_COLTU|nr:uncharacterized protein CTRU02_00077 [Colletotrichum truncatum]KAF6801328.1 hypothetical protein CTRU02_00077 [Colletotrichum truncatum]
MGRDGCEDHDISRSLQEARLTSFTTPLNCQGAAHYPEEDRLINIHMCWGQTLEAGSAQAFSSSARTLELSYFGRNYDVQAYESPRRHHCSVDLETLNSPPA